MTTVKLLASFRDIAGKKELIVPLKPGGTVRDLIQSIGEINPDIRETIVDEEGELTDVVQILLAGRNIIWLDGLDTVIESEQSVTLIPPVAGG